MANRGGRPWDRHQQTGRITGARERRRVLIVGEDAKSSCLYFQGFKVDARRVEILTLGAGMNTDSLVRHAVDMGARAKRDGRPFNQIWCVFDRDSFPAQNFNRAFQLAENHGISVAWANEAFELWYLLHFNYVTAGISRTEYGSRLCELLGCKYDKADAQIYARLESQQPTAIKNALRLERHWSEMGGCNPEKSNPSTSVHRLVEFLNELKELGPADAA